MWECKACTPIEKNSVVVLKKSWEFICVTFQPFYLGPYTQRAVSHHRDSCSSIFFASLFKKFKN